MWYVDATQDWVVFEVRRPRQETQLTVARILALKLHDKGTKPGQWSVRSIMTACMSSIGTDLIYVCSVRVSDPHALAHLRTVVLSTISHIVEGVPGICPAPLWLWCRCVKKGGSRFVSTLSEMRVCVHNRMEIRWKYRCFFYKCLHVQMGGGSVL